MTSAVMAVNVIAPLTVTDEEMESMFGDRDECLVVRRQEAEQAVWGSAIPVVSVLRHTLCSLCTAPSSVPTMGKKKLSLKRELQGAKRHSY